MLYENMLNLYKGNSQGTVNVSFYKTPAGVKNMLAYSISMAVFMIVCLCQEYLNKNSQE